jgi:hypothetical protein
MRASGNKRHAARALERVIMSDPTIIDASPEAVN